MDIQTLLEWTDKQVLDKTGKHLDSLQESILQGIWEHQDYEKIAENNQRSYDHIKKEAWKLWQLLSDVFEEDIKKSNRPLHNIISRPKVFLVKEYTRIKIILIASYFFSKIELATTDIHFSYRTA